MKKEELYLIEAMVSACKGVPTPPPQEQIDMEYFFKKAKEHKIENMLFKGVCENISGFYNCDKIIGQWQKENLISSVSLIRLKATVNAIADKFEEKGKSILLLKGAILKNLYPKIEMRTMGDTDIIIKKEEFEDVKKIFEEFGYKPQIDSHGNPQFVKENNYKFEAFFELKTIDKLWEKADNIEGKNYIYKLSNEMFLFHLISHLAKHIKYKGAGIRNLSDIYLVMEKWHINYEKVRKELEKKGLIPFFDTVVKVLEVFFGFKSDKISSEASEEEAYKLMEFMIKYGVYGAQSENNVFVTKAGRKQSFKIKVKKFFPSTKSLPEKYSYAKRFPFLLPFAWIHRLLDKRFKEKRTFKDTVKEIKEADIIKNYQQDIIKQFKL